MAELIIHSEKIKENIKYLNNYFEVRNIEWSLITKIFSGDKTFLNAILTKDVVKNMSSVGDSRLASLRNLKEVYPQLKTFYINPPALGRTDDVVAYANVSLNTSIPVIKALNKSAKKIDVIHKIIIMIEQGELREGIKNEDVIAFYENVCNLSHIEVIGIGSNLGCMFGVEPTHDILSQLSLNRTLISKKFNKDLEFISGGTSITLPLLERALVPKDINHYRIGEAAFLGISPLDNKQFKDLHTETFEFYANIIELNEKNVVPGHFTHSCSNKESMDDNDENSSSKSYKAILDFGLLDVNKEDIESENNFTYVGATSDMTVIDLGDNKTKYKLGDTIKFKLNYIAVARLMSSKFVDKIYI
ncbi:MAG: putative amino acid racemase [Patiriisocius sp.]|jgi:predicted amino acid racemase